MWTWLCKDIILGGRWLILVILLYVFQLAVAVVSGALFFVWGISLPVLLVVGVLLIETANETDVLWCSLPLSRGDIVRRRYFSAFAGLFAGTAITWLAGRISFHFILAHREGSPAFLMLSLHAAHFALLLIGMALFLPFYFRFGLFRGGKFFLVGFGGTVIVLPLLMQVLAYLFGTAGSLADPAIWRQAASYLESVPPPDSSNLGYWLLGLFMALALAAYAGSCALSQRFYRTREF